MSQASPEPSAVTPCPVPQAGGRTAEQDRTAATGAGVTHASDIALRLADVAMWQWDFGGDRLEWSEAMHELHDVGKEAFGGGFGAWVALILPADRARFSAEITWALSGQKPIDSTYRTLVANGETRHIAVRARRVMDGGTRSNRLVGVCIDRTAEAVAQDRLRRERMISDQVAEISGIGGWEYEVGSGLIKWSGQTRRIHGVGADFEPTRENVLQFYPPEARESLAVAGKRCIETGERWTLELPFVTAAGEHRWICAIGCADFYEGRTRRIFGTIEDVTERRERRLELVAAKEAAESANRAKTDFLAVISHELRTPLNGVLGLSDLLALGEKDPERLHVIQLLRNSGESLLAIINEVLEFSRIDSGVLRRKETAFAISDVINRCVAKFEPVAVAKSVAFVLGLPAGLPPRVIGDPEKLGDLLSSFISNACKFTEKGEVRTTVDTLPAHHGRCRIRFRIDDSGIGIPESRQGDLFKPFALVDSSSSRRQGGMGMGLALAKRLCDAMGGTLELHSKPGRGTSVSVTLEFPTAEAPADLPTLSEVSSAPVTTAGFPASLSAALAQSRRILVAEDNPTNQALIRHLLRKLGKEFDLVGDGAAAVQAVRDGAYRVILMDIQMPGMSGIEATRRIRKEIPAGTQPWIIALTAQVFDEDRRQCFEAGMNEFLTKPARLDRLSEAIERGFTVDMAA